MVIDSHGARIVGETAGEGPAVLCIQGVGVVGNGWLPQVQALTDGFRMITFDNRGIGGSTRGPDPLTIEMMAADAEAIMTAERCEAVHLIGHSLGGLVAIHLASMMPSRIKSLSLLCTFADGAEPSRFSWRMAALGMRSRLGTRAMRRNGMLDMILPPEYIRQVGRTRLAEQLAPLFGHDLADQPAIAWQQLSAMSKYNALHRLPGLSRIPTMVISGAHDPIAPPHLGRRIADGIVGARFITFADASHALPIQCAERLNPLLREHLQTADALAISGA
jgi:pimeloyl-ACP methyl ester carboxylesterase